MTTATAPTKTINDMAFAPGSPFGLYTQSLHIDNMVVVEANPDLLFVTMRSKKLREDKLFGFKFLPELGVWEWSPDPTVFRKSPLAECLYNLKPIETV